MSFLKSGLMIAETFIRFFYTSVILFFLVTPSLSDILTIQDLAKAVNEERYCCATYHRAYLVSLMAKSDDRNLEILAQCISKYRGSRYIENALSDKISNINVAFFGYGVIS